MGETLSCDTGNVAVEWTESGSPATSSVRLSTRMDSEDSRNATGRFSCDDKL